MISFDKFDIKLIHLHLQQHQQPHLRGILSFCARQKERTKEKTRGACAWMRAPRNAVVRKIAAQELQRLQARTYGASEDEAVAFAAEMQNALDALDGARETGSKLSAALKAAAAEVEKIRAECNRFGNLGLVQNWLDGDQRRFDALGKTGRPGGKS